MNEMDPTEDLSWANYSQDSGSATSYYDSESTDTYAYGSNMSLLTAKLIKQPVHMIVVYSIAYGIIFLLAVVGNALVIAVIYKEPSMRNVTNYFILNMAVADLLVAIVCVPVTLLANIFTGWRFGAFLCKVTPYVQGVVQCASVNTLAAIAIDRYRAICYSRHSKITTCASRTTLFGIWVFAGTIMIPLAVFYQRYMHPDYVDMPICHQIWPSYNLQRGYFLVALFTMCYILPLLMIVLCYVLIAKKVWKRNAPGVESNGRLIIYKSKVKVLKMLAVIVLLFALSWLMLYAVYLRMYFGGENMSETDYNLITEVIIPVAQWLGASNSCINPIIYCFFSKKYRRGFKNIMYCKLSTLSFRRQSRTNQSLSTRYVNVENSSDVKHDIKLERKNEHRVSSNKFMVVAFCNGKMTVSFRKENGSDESSF